MTFRETDQFLTGAKLRLVKKNKTRHFGYEFLLPNGRSPFPQLIRLSRSNGDVPKYVLDSIAGALGLTAHEFEAMAKCGLRRECYLLALSVVMLMRYYEDSITWVGMIASVRLVLGELGPENCHQWKSPEAKLTRRLASKLAAMSKPSTAEFNAIRDQIRELIESGFAAGQGTP